VLQMDLFADLETRSRVDLVHAGVQRYAIDPSTQITTAVWIFDGTMKTACSVHPDLGTHGMAHFYADVTNCHRFIAHHAAFDANIISKAGTLPWLVIPPDKISCTMARAQALSLPGGLEALCSALEIPGKSPRGHALVMLTCKPQKDGTFNEDRTVFQELLSYNIQDVRCLLNVHGMLPELSAAEHRIFKRTWQKNIVGLPIDVELASAIAQRRAEIEQDAETELRLLTNNKVTGVTQRQRIKQWANETHNAKLNGTRKHEISELLEEPELHADVRSVLEVVQRDGGSAPMKAQALLNRHVGGYYKDATRYFGARSGRGTSEGANMYNIARPSGRYDVNDVIDGLKAGFKYDNTALTDALRGCIVAPPGYTLIDNDLSNAELRLALWQCGDTARLDILAAGGDLYMHNAISMWGLPKSATKDTHPRERHNGKTVTLAANYQLGWKKYKAQMRQNGTPVTDIKAQTDISSYRLANPKLVRLWDDLKEAFENCLYEPAGRYFYAGKIALIKDNKRIWMVLPSGRAIPHYCPFVGDDGNLGFFRARHGGMVPQKIFGGSLLEISCQSMTRDIITACEDAIEKELPDITLILDIYDSIVALAPIEIAKQCEEKMRVIMRRPLTWTAGLPLNAEGYSGPRMKK
jgi:DNA polymerase bacteriophage-type